MFIAHELGKFESEVKELYPEELARWMAFLELRGQREKDAVKKSMPKKPPPVRRGHR